MNEKNRLALWATRFFAFLVFNEGGGVFGGLAFDDVVVVGVGYGGVCVVKRAGVWDNAI